MTTKLGDTFRVRIDDVIGVWEQHCGPRIDKEFSDEDMVALFGIIAMSLGHTVGLIPHALMQDEIIKGIHKTGIASFDKGVIDGREEYKARLQ